MTYKHAVAWLVSDDEHSEIIFSKNYFEAKRWGASELGVDFECVEIRRAKKWDAHALRGVYPTRVDLWNDGWWFECHQCGCMAEKYSSGFFEGDAVLCYECKTAVYDWREPSAPERVRLAFGPMYFTPRENRWTKHNPLISVRLHIDGVRPVGPMLPPIDAMPIPTQPEWSGPDPYVWFGPRVGELV